MKGPQTFPGEAEANIDSAKEYAKQVRNSAARFIITELQLGLSFAQSAANYSAEGRTSEAERSLQAAKEAYNAVAKFLPKAVLTMLESEEVARNLSRLEASLNITKAR